LEIFGCFKSEINRCMLIGHRYFYLIITTLIAFNFAMTMTPSMSFVNFLMNIFQSVKVVLKKYFQAAKEFTLKITTQEFYEIEKARSSLCWSLIWQERTRNKTKNSSSLSQNLRLHSITASQHLERRSSCIWDLEDFHKDL